MKMAKNVDGSTKNNIPSIKMAENVDGSMADYGFFRGNREEAQCQEVC
jgi:hypothetical protein